MEDVVPEAASLLHPVNIGTEEGETSRELAEDRAIVGFALVSGDEEKPEEEVDKQPAGDGNDEGKGGGGGGLFEGLISNLASPFSPKAGSETSKRKADVLDDSNNTTEKKSCRSSEEKAAEGGGGDGGGGGGGGLIKNIISNFFHQGEDAEVRENENREQEEIAKNTNRENEAAKTEDHGGGGGIIENIVSHLPASLLVPDDAAPTSEEATILINSIVRD